MPVVIKMGSWLCATFLIFSALVWMLGGFLVIGTASVSTVAGLEKIPSLFWSVRAVVSALSVIGAVLLVLGRGIFLRLLVVWFAAELMLLGWLYIVDFLPSQIDEFSRGRNLVILQLCDLGIVLFAWMKQRLLFASASLRSE